MQQISAKNAAIIRDIIREETKILRTGENTDVDEDVMVNDRKKLRALVLEFKAEDAYNIDESGFFLLFAVI